MDYGSELTVLLTERAHHLRHHPGQISFPGGAVDEVDNSGFDAALREAVLIRAVVVPIATGADALRPCGRRHGPGGVQPRR